MANIVIYFILFFLLKAFRLEYSVTNRVTKSVKNVVQTGFRVLGGFFGDPCNVQYIVIGV